MTKIRTADLLETRGAHEAVRAAVPTRRRISRKLIVGGLLTASVSFFALAGPASAINDPRVPANECSPDHSASVGDPLDGGGNPGINFHTPQVSPFVSGNNPGVSTGALGQANSNAIGTCANS